MPHHHHQHHHCFVGLVLSLPWLILDATLSTHCSFAYLLLPWLLHPALICLSPSQVTGLKLPLRASTLPTRLLVSSSLCPDSLSHPPQRWTPTTASFFSQPSLLHPFFFFYIFCSFLFLLLYLSVLFFPCSFHILLSYLTMTLRLARLVPYLSSVLVAFSFRRHLNKESAAFGRTAWYATPCMSVSLGTPARTKVKWKSPDFRSSGCRSLARDRHGRLG